MARYTGAVCRMCRREGAKLFLKGERCYSDKCSFTARKDGKSDVPATPGQHGMSRKKVSEYGIQLREKQKTRRYYGVLESQFAKYFAMAERKQGMTGPNLLSICETRLDNVVYRAGLASSRAEARQLVVHGHYVVDGKRVNIPSYLVKEGEVIAVCEKSRGSEKIKAVMETNAARPVPMWMEFDAEKAAAKIVRMPNRDDIDYEVQENLIVEYYSK